MASHDPAEPDKPQSSVQHADQPLGATVALDEAKSAEVKSYSMKNQYKCEFCELTFRRKDGHDRHRYSHTGVLEHPCPKPNCNKAYSNRSHLNRHVRAQHFSSVDSKRVTVDCKHTACEMKFTNKQSMERHYQAKHVIGKPYVCEECDERFWRKIQLKMHKFKHTGQYPHTCEHCGQGFVNLQTLRNHRCSHNAQKCSQCSKEFKWWTELVAHRRLEHPRQYRCTDCSKQFHTKRSLKMHARIHLADDQRDVFECPHEGCPRFYEHQRNLYFHVRSKHEGAKQYVCAVPDCGMQLATKQKLDMHTKLHQSVAKSSLRKKSSSKTPPARARSQEKLAISSDEVIHPGLCTHNTIDATLEPVERPRIDPEANDGSDTQSATTLEKHHNLDSASESEAECALRVSNILSANLDSIKKQIVALRSDVSFI